MHHRPEPAAGTTAGPVAERPPGAEPPPDPRPPDPGPTPGTPPEETPPPVVSAQERARITALEDAVLIATGCSNTVDLAFSAGRLDGLPGDERAALEARLGLDLLVAGRPGRSRSLAEIAAARGASEAEVQRLLDGALARLRAPGQT